MTIYYCDQGLESIMTCIYEAWTSRKGQENIRLLMGEPEQLEMFHEYIYVISDPEKARKVCDAIVTKISPAVYQEIAYSTMSVESDLADVIYRVLLLGFAYGGGVLGMRQYEAVNRFLKIRSVLGREAYHFQEFLRFNEVRQGLYVAHFEPHNRVVLSLGEAFSDRMPSEHWLIIDDVHKEAVVHPKNEQYFLRVLTDDELIAIRESEESQDEYIDLWKTFFDSIAIKERTNKKCQDNHIPLWMRKHAVEFL